MASIMHTVPQEQRGSSGDFKAFCGEIIPAQRMHTSVFTEPWFLKYCINCKRIQKESRR